MFTVQQQNAAIAAAQFQQQVARGLESIYSAFATLMRCEANDRMLQELCREFMGADVAPDLDIFRNLLDLNQDVMKSLVQRPVEVTRQQLIEDILALLASKNGGRDGKYDQWNLKSEASRMASWSVDSLRARLHEIRTKQQMSTQSVASLKQMVADSRPTTGYPVLPKTVWSGTTHIPLNAATIRAMDAWEIKKYSRLYGQQQLNDRLRETA
jgi:hypothetical protein